MLARGVVVGDWTDVEMRWGLSGDAAQELEPFLMTAPFMHVPITRPEVQTSHHRSIKNAYMGLFHPRVQANENALLASEHKPSRRAHRGI
jgi:hypothetical protein